MNSLSDAKGCCASSSEAARARGSLCSNTGSAADDDSLGYGDTPDQDQRGALVASLVSSLSFAKVRDRYAASKLAVCSEFEVWLEGKRETRLTLFCEQMSAAPAPARVKSSCKAHLTRPSPGVVPGLQALSGLAARFPAVHYRNQAGRPT